jgi:beta-glucosidase
MDIVCSSVPSPFNPPISFEDAGRRADHLLSLMSLDEKLLFVTGHNSFYIRGFPEYGIPELYLSDASGGLNIRRQLNDQLEQSTAFPAPISLAASWNPRLAKAYARSIGEECRAGGIAVLLGPGVNIYRVSQNGRNFEYYGEDPFLASRVVEGYVQGMLETGTIPTLKHFVANNTEFFRRTSNSVVSNRALHEIYLPAFKAGIDAGAMAVMTSYNQLNGEWAGQSRAAITDLLRQHLGFRWLVMTDWWSVWDAEKIMNSGQDLEMPGEHFIRTDGRRLIDEGKVFESTLDRMAKNILRTTIAIGLHDRPQKDASFLNKYAEHQQVALQTARESIVLLKNEGILPLRAGVKNILLTGSYVEKIPQGGGSAAVEGFGHVTMLEALKTAYGDQLHYIKEPSDEEIARAETVFLNVGRIESEGWDHPLDLPPGEEAAVLRAVQLNQRVVVIVNAGSGIKMEAWHDQVAAILFAWYPGQIGNTALAEILSGAISPSGKLPFTNERSFEDSPGHAYIPLDHTLYEGWQEDSNMKHSVFDIVYDEDIFVGYRWYENKGIKPRYAFGHGLSYSKFEYTDLRIELTSANPTDVIVEFSMKNVGLCEAAEIAQIYVRDVAASVSRPQKELKGFAKTFLATQELARVRILIPRHELAFWNTSENAWRVEAGEFQILVGASSADIRLVGSFQLT